MSEPSHERRTLGQKLGHLINEVHPKDRGSYSYQEIADLIRSRAGDSGGPTVSHGTIHSLHRDKVSNPGVDSLRALADFFGVPVSYFIDDEVTDRVDRRMREIKDSVTRAAATDDLADALESTEVRAVAFRLAGLSPRALRGLKSVVDGLRQAEGLPKVTPHRSRKSPGKH